MGGGGFARNRDGPNSWRERDPGMHLIISRRRDRPDDVDVDEKGRYLLRLDRFASNVPKGYRREDLHDAWSRYLPSPPGKSATAATYATSPDLLGQNVADGKNVADDVAEVLPIGSLEKPRKISPVALVADVAHSAAFRCGTCVQCGADDGMAMLREIGGQSVPLHRECIKFWTMGQ